MRTAVESVRVNLYGGMGGGGLSFNKLEKAAVDVDGAHNLVHREMGKVMRDRYRVSLDVGGRLF